MTEQTNNITRESHPEIFEYFDDHGWDYEEALGQEHEKHDITCYKIRMVVDDKTIKDESLHGNWMGWLTSSYNYGSEPEDYPQELYRIEQKEVTTIEWVPVE